MARGKLLEMVVFLNSSVFLFKGDRTVQMALVQAPSTVGEPSSLAS